MSGVKKYVVSLTSDERAFLEGLISKGRGLATRLARARVLLKADEGWDDKRTAEALHVSISTVLRTRRTFVEEGFDAALAYKKRATPAITPIFDGEKEARLIQLACSTPPDGHSRWSLRLLEEKVVELGIVEKASDSTIGRVFKKTNFNLTARNSG